MGKAADIEPRWLVSLLTQWARHELASERHHKGYPTKAAGFSEKTTGGYNHTDPTALSAKDFRELEKAIEECRQSEPNLCAALMMFYKPWGVKVAQAAGFPFGNSTYYERLHRGHKYIAGLMAQETA